MSLWDEISADGSQFLSEFGRSITFRGISVVVLIDTNPIEQNLENGGFVYTSGFRVRMLAVAGSTYATTPPANGEVMTIYGDPYTVKQVTIRPPSPWIDAFVIASNQ
jgi:hypothetical protein